MTQHKVLSDDSMTAMDEISRVLGQDAVILSTKKIGKKIAKNGKSKYLKYFNSDIISEYILSKSFDYKLKQKVIWE